MEFKADFISFSFPGGQTTNEVNYRASRLQLSACLSVTNTELWYYEQYVSRLTF